MKHINVKLFKDNIHKNKTEYCKAAKKLLNCKNNLDEMKQLLFNGEKEDYINGVCEHGDCEMVKKCGKDKKIRNGEKRICRCFKFDEEYCRAEHSECLLLEQKNGKYNISKNSDYIVVDYEVPTKKSNKRNNIGGVDLIIRNKNNIEDEYIVEVKPIKNDEPLLRMIAEIYTYAISGVEGHENAKKAIGFFKDSFQYNEFVGFTKSEVKNARKDILELIKNSIDVFVFEKHGNNNNYIIKKCMKEMKEKNTDLSSKEAIYNHYFGN